MASEMSLHHYGKPLVCTYSGGKDSDVMLEFFRYQFPHAGPLALVCRHLDLACDSPQFQ